MFDIGFSELLVIGVVALVVLGPERLPRVARTLGILMGRMQRYVADVKADIGREIELDELRKMRESVEKSASEVKSSVEREMREAEETINAALASPGNPEPIPEPLFGMTQAPESGAATKAPHDRPDQPDPVPK